MGPAPWGWGAEAEERFPNVGKPPLRRKSIGPEGKNLRLSEEGEAADLWQTGHSEKYTYVSRTVTCVHRCARALGPGVWGLENRPGVRTAVGCGEMD